MSEPAPEITPELIAASPFALVLAPDGRATMTVSPSVDDASLGAYLHQIAEHVRTGRHRQDCAECASGRPHGHPEPLPDDTPTSTTP